MDRTNLSSGSKWEDIVGYSRAVRIGNVIEVSGTVAVDENGNVIGGTSAYEQAKFILSKISSYVEKAGGSAKQIIRTRMYVTDILMWEEVGRAHGEFFREIRPATSMVEVSGLISEEYLVEIEATALVS
ncbi:MAG: RidA family protein [Ignavibacteria bacterium]|nr:RidA family protein [Ignavibacteria bacterium]